MLNFRNINIVAFVLLAGIAVYDGYDSVPAVIYVFAFVVYIAALSAGSFVMSLQFYLKSYVQGSRSSRRIALTFDDGPLPEKTDQILSILSEHQVKAAFFCIGNRVHESHQLVKRISDEGHIIGNHSYSHPPTFGFLSRTTVYDELMSTDRAVESAIGKRPAFFRPPYGVTNPMIAAALQKAGHLSVGWSNRSFDTVIKSPDALFTRVTKNLKSGDIILFHDYCDSTISILSKFIIHARQQGYEFVRVDELVNQPPYR